ncbi:MAG: hypothetical protein ACFFCE_05765 [Promethearchaeota archaeon]
MCTKEEAMRKLVEFMTPEEFTESLQETESSYNYLKEVCSDLQLQLKILRETIAEKRSN